MTRFSFVLLGVALLSFPAYGQMIPCNPSEQSCADVNSWIMQDQLEMQQRHMQAQQDQINAMQRELEDQRQRQNSYPDMPPVCVVDNAC